jgi:threonine aldolase
MLHLESDYNNGAHPKVMEHLVETNNQKSISYGFDVWTESAKAKIRKATACPDADVYFLVGGTQTNATVLDSMMERYEAAVACTSGHINIHESGAVEFTGHKVIALQAHNGLLTADTLRQYMKTFTADADNTHMVQPGVVYTTFPSELGTIYKAAELSELYDVCREYGLKLYVDGARMGYGLASYDNDITLPFLASHCDAFYIGGTKVGALCGEAVVFPRKGCMPKHFFTSVKQHGALLAKGRLVGVQFDALFTDNLYYNIARHAIDLAMLMRDMLQRLGLKMWMQSPTNQQFVILPNDVMKRLEEKVVPSVWCPYDDENTVCRFVTSWATDEKEIADLEAALKDAIAGKA